MNSSNIIKIRAHHLLCIQGFQGYGYSKDFVDNMDRIIKIINLDPDREIELIRECDDICLHCPHHIKGKCRKRIGSSWKIRLIDKRILKELKLKENTTGKVNDFLSFVNKNFRNISDVKNICRCCSWKEKCLWYDSLKND